VRNKKVLNSLKGEEEEREGMGKESLPELQPIRGHRRPKAVKGGEGDGAEQTMGSGVTNDVRVLVNVTECRKEPEEGEDGSGKVQG